MNSMISTNEEAAAGDDPYADMAHETPVLLQYWQAVLRHKIPIATILAVCVALGIIITLLMTPYFISSSRIEISRKQDNVTNVEGVMGFERSYNSLEFYQTQYSMLESRSIAERVARAKNLASNSDFFETFGIDTSQSEIFSDKASGQDDARLKLAAGLLKSHITVSPVRGSSLVDLRFESPSPVLSAQMANAWVDEFIAADLERRFNSTVAARTFLEEQLSTLKQRLEDSERNLSSYADNKEIITLSTSQTADGKTVSQRTLASANLEALNSVLAQATADRILAESEAGQDAGDKNALENAALNSLRQERAMAQAEYAKLLVQFEPEYPAAKAVETKISALNKSIAGEETRSRAGTTARYREALERERKLLGEVNLLKRQLGSERRDSIQYNILQREVDTNRQLYDGLLQRYKEIGVAGAGTNNILIVDRAQPSRGRSSPNLFFNVILALLAGLGLSAVFVLVMEQIDQTIKEPGDLKAKLGIALLGSVPNIEKDGILLSLSDKKSVAWEAYFSIRTSLSFLTDHGVPRSILLTSTRPNEGKSTSSLALGVVLAGTGKRILLIDGDMRNPSLHQMLGIDNSMGMSNYLSGSDNFAELIKQNTSYNFDVMTAGPIPPNAAELLSGRRMHELVTKLCEIYDTVIIDAPPVLGLADVLLLADAVEGVILTIEAGGAKTRAIQSAIGRVRSSHAHVFGGIVTKVQPQHSGYAYAYQYNYGNKWANEA